MQTTTLDAIVKLALVDAGETTVHKYARFLRWGLSAFRDFKTDSAQEVKTVRLPMNHLKQVVIPDDYTDWTKIGIQVGDKIKTFSLNQDIARLHQSDPCGCPEPFRDNININEWPASFWETGGFGGYYFFNYNDYGECLGGLYGHGGGYNHNGYFTIIKEAQPPVIQFDSRVRNTWIYMEYISNGFCPTEHTLVNPYAEQAITDYIHWKRLWFAGDITASQIAKQDYYTELHKCNFRIQAPTVKDILEASRRHYGQAIKY